MSSRPNFFSIKQIGRQYPRNEFIPTKHDIHIDITDVPDNANIIIIEGIGRRIISTNCIGWLRDFHDRCQEKWYGEPKELSPALKSFL